MNMTTFYFVKLCHKQNVLYAIPVHMHLSLYALQISFVIKMRKQAFIIIHYAKALMVCENAEQCQRRRNPVHFVYGRLINGRIPFLVKSELSRL